MSQYIVQIIAFQLFFLIIYDVFLKKETFFNWNRFYLLFTSVLALVLPFVKIAGLKNIVPRNFIFNLPSINLNSNTVILDEVNLGVEVSKPFWTLQNLFFIGVSVAGILFMLKLFKLIKLIIKNPKQKFQNVFLIALNNSKSAFSFFNYLFIGEDIAHKERSSIIKHEVIHIKERHTLDLLFFEFLRIVFWFNPLVYIYQKRISDLHEYIADSKAIQQDKKQYYENLLSQVFDTGAVSFINPFFKQSLIKKRIIMLQKSKSKQIHLIKYTLLIPIIMGMLIYSSCSEEVNHTSIPNDAKIESSELLNKINAVKEQIEIQGNISKEEEKGIALMYKLFTTSGDGVDQNFIADIQNYIEANNKSELHFRISNLFEIIQKQGNVTSEEELSLKTLLTLVSEEGLNSPFYEEVKDRIEVPFNVIEKSPMFPNVEIFANEADNKNAFNSTINSFVMKNFNTSLGNNLGLTGVQQVRVFFKISNDGSIKDIKARAPHPKLTDEAIRVIKMLPTMIPGEQLGKKVTVPYYLPIKFQINE